MLVTRDVGRNGLARWQLFEGTQLKFQISPFRRPLLSLRRRERASTKGLGSLAHKNKGMLLIGSAKHHQSVPPERHVSLPDHDPVAGSFFICALTDIRHLFWEQLWHAVMIRVYDDIMQ